MPNLPQFDQALHDLLNEREKLIVGINDDLEAIQARYNANVSYYEKNKNRFGLSFTEAFNPENLIDKYYNLLSVDLASQTSPNSLKNFETLKGSIKGLIALSKQVSYFKDRTELGLCSVNTLNQTNKVKPQPATVSPLKKPDAIQVNSARQPMASYGR